jgi:murein DD-endopeptidase MepM/ murein hydrolase activator NlpD
MTARPPLGRVLAAAALVVVALAWAARDAWSRRRPIMATVLRVPPAWVDRVDTLRRNETLSDVLARAGVTGPDHAAFLAAATALQPRRLRPGLAFQVRRLRADSIARRLIVRTEPERRVRLERLGGDSGWVQTVEAIPWSATPLRLSGVITSSLYDALDSSAQDHVLPAAQRRQLAWAIADVYDWEVDFTRDVRPGDGFTVLFERLESPDGERRVGRILGARVEVGKTPIYAFYFEAAPGRGTFFDGDGRSLKRAFLRTPLQFRRVSSRFGGRYHPILREWRSHKGIDYSASAGTPVRATADGIVTQAGLEGGYGKLVELRHANGIRTRYGHLSAFGRGIRIGARVSQSATVGYVGSTGLSTGPHLHYEFLVNGRATNPQRYNAGSGTPVPRESRSAFDSLRVGLVEQLAAP